MPTADGWPGRKQNLTRIAHVAAHVSRVNEGWHRLPREWAVAGLLAANVAPLAGVVALGWSGGELLVFYWLENGIIGAVTVPKLLLAQGDSGDGTQTSRVGRIFGALFFMVHYGMFWLVHGAFVLVLAMAVGGAGLEVSELFGPGLLLAVLAVVVGQGVEFWTDYVRDRGYRQRSSKEQMTEPYGRVMVLHVVIVIGAFPVLALGSPLPALTLLVLLKFGLDVWGYARHADSGEEPAGPAGPASTRGDALESEP